MLGVSGESGFYPK